MLIAGTVSTCLQLSASRFMRSPGALRIGTSPIPGLMEEERPANGDSRSSPESLFCLELLVDSVCINRELLQPPTLGYGHAEDKMTLVASQICVAFRLLDFPTLLVYPPEPPDTLETPREPSQLLRVPFGRGKSCVFSMCARTLRAHLSRAPLYAMLLQLGGPLPRLLASTPLSLAKATEHRGAHALCDLMGREVGRLALAYRLLNLGTSLLSHMPPNSDQKLAYSEEPGKIAAEGSARPFGDRAILQPLPLEGPEEPQLLVVSEAEAAPSPCKASVSTQTRPLQGKPSQSSSARGSKTDLEIEANVFCPPPLFYCSAAPAPKEELPMQRKSLIKTEQLLIQEPVSEEECLVNPMKQTPAETGEHIRSSSPQPPLKPPGPRCTINQLPLLNALLVELSLLSNQPVTDRIAVHPQLAWLYRSVSSKETSIVPQIQSKLQVETDILEVSEKSTKSSSSKHKITDVLKKDTSLSQKSQKETKKTTEPKSSETKDCDQSTKKLFYGLTNTLKLRLQLKNPDMLILHERREQYRKKQQEMLKVKKRRNRGMVPKEKQIKHSLMHMKSLDGASSGRISYPKRSFDENIETLIQSRVNNELNGNKNEIKPHSLKHIAGHDLKNPVENAVSNNLEDNNLCSLEKPQEDNTNLCSLEKQQIDSEYCRENQMNSEVLLSKPVAQDYDMGGVVAKEDINVFHYNTNGNFGSFKVVECKENPNNSLRSSPDVMYSDDFSGSQECTRNSHDVTSPDHTDPLDSFPKTVVVNPQKNPSGSDSESSVCMNSEKSVRTVSISAPFPVPSTASPVQSSNRTHKLKDKHQGLSAAVRITNENLSMERLFDKQGQQRDITSYSNIQTLEKSNIQGSIAPDSKFEDDDQDSDKSLSIRTSQVSSYLPSNISELDLSALGSTESDHVIEGMAQSGLSTLEISNQYKHISELVINQLPGYTL